MDVLKIALMTMVTFVSACRPTPTAAPPCECPEAPRERVAAEVGQGDVAALNRVIEARRTIRTYSEEPVPLDDVMALLWAAQGVTLSPEEADRVDGQGLRASPSAGATYPLETYLLAVRVDGLTPGLYHYRPADNELTATSLQGDQSQPVADACLGQRVVRTAAAVIVFAAVIERTASRYGDRAERYVMMELGHANQNAHLMATARGLGACAIGAFEDSTLARALELPQEHVPYYLLTVGRPREQTNVSVPSD
jgi:SagB-type dehydrogenase family enzyme